MIMTPIITPKVIALKSSRMIRVIVPTSNIPRKYPLKMNRILKTITIAVSGRKDHAFIIDFIIFLAQTQRTNLLIHKMGSKYKCKADLAAEWVSSVRDEEGVNIVD
jgi:hypothetical protein